MVRFDIWTQHRLHILIADIVRAVGEAAQDNALAMREHTAHLQHIEKPVDTVVGFIHLFHKEDDVGVADGV